MEQVCNAKPTLLNENWGLRESASCHNPKQEGGRQTRIDGRNDTHNRNDAGGPSAGLAVLNERDLVVFRTIPCKELREKGQCRFGSKCRFSHSLKFPRRNPEKYSYLPSYCPKIQFSRNEQGSTKLINNCKLGRQCSGAHTIEEQLFHPLIYKTKVCPNWPDCHKVYCSWAHGSHELRFPADEGETNPEPSKKGSKENCKLTRCDVLTGSDSADGNTTTTCGSPPIDVNVIPPEEDQSHNLYAAATYAVNALNNNANMLTANLLQSMLPDQAYIANANQQAYAQLTLPQVYAQMAPQQSYANNYLIPNSQQLNPNTLRHPGQNSNGLLSHSSADSLTSLLRLIGELSPNTLLPSPLGMPVDQPPPVASLANLVAAATQYPQYPQQQAPSPVISPSELAAQFLATGYFPSSHTQYRNASYDQNVPNLATLLQMSANAQQAYSNSYIRHPARENSV
eukprot:Platyproteum_vivax@DN1827_c0_g1_i1.p1